MSENITTASFADLLVECEGVTEFSSFEENVQRLLTAGANTELRRIAAGFCGFFNSPESWRVDLELIQVSIDTEGCPRPLDLMFRVEARSERIWTERWMALEGVVTIHRSTGGNLTLSNDFGGQLQLSTGKTREEVHEYLLEWDDTSLAQDAGEEVIPTIRRLAGSLVNDLLECYALQQMLGSPQFRGEYE